MTGSNVEDNFEDSIQGHQMDVDYSSAEEIRVLMKERIVGDREKRHINIG